MEEIKKFFYEKKLFAVALIFIILSAADILFATLIGRGIMFDGSIWFSDIISSRMQNRFNFELYWGDNARGIVNIINTLPINLALLLPIKSKALLAAIFSLPFFLNNFLILIAQYFLTLKSKRLDIFFSALFLHSFVILPLSLYPINEQALASSVLLLLFHYLSADIKYNKKDIFFIILMAAFSFLSTEAMIYCGVILFIISLYYFAKAETKLSKFVKLFIGIACLVISLFQNDLLRHFSFDFANPDVMRTEIEFMKLYLNSYYFALDAFFLLLVVSAIFIPKKIEKISFSLLIAIPLVFFVYTICTQGYISSGFFSKRFFPGLILPVILIVNTLVYITIPKINDEKKAINSYNIAIIMFVCAIFNLMFSITHSIQFNSSINKLRTAMQTSETSLLNPYRDTNGLYDMNTPGSYLFNCDTYTYDSINFSKEYTLTKIVVPDDNPENTCPKKFYFNENMLQLPFNAIVEKSSVWDLTQIKESINSNEEDSQKYQPENFQ